ncbi:uncharacterized protein APUU_31245A [Aspergillus puulaauensis]|uniref:F-box domain-containing protein n=1 Tax=Aspergillus puulaauensis TaxID=1220207 RepID=A0A7R8AN00_9EURO|nr:uncharacterized protein APUU_31245A [Aspergillus puulaauensis]BCS23020.1 hypothetical protein APUU_31245A [Aspergillus puulaauensis]
MGQSESRPVLAPETSIDGLPPEIIEGIAQYLGPDDLHSFHKASRYTHNSTLIVIRRLALSTMRTDLSTPSLNALDQISRQSIVARHMQKLMVVLDSSPPASEGKT